MKTTTAVLAVAAYLAMAPGAALADQPKDANNPSGAAVASGAAAGQGKTERGAKGRESVRASAVPVRIEGAGPQSGASNAPLKFNPKGEQKPAQ